MNGEELVNPVQIQNNSSESRIVVEGYSVAINTVFKEFPREHDIDKFEVNVGKKGCKMAICDPDEKACDNG